MDDAVISRFWAKVKKTESCWLWTASKSRGYGKIVIAGKPRWAHRVAYEIQVGPIPDGKRILHLCDNPPCVRVGPGHLILGTQAQNVLDALKKGRMLFGEKNGQSRLNEQQVREIRTLYEAGYGSHDDLADLFEVCAGTIHHVLVRKTWKHVV